MVRTRSVQMQIMNLAPLFVGFKAGDTKHYDDINEKSMACP